MMLAARPPVRRVIVVDPSLIDTTGHYLEYDIALREAVQAAGIPVVILAHRAVAADLAQQHQLTAVFSADAWSERRVPAERPIVRRQALHRVLATGPQRLLKLIERAAERPKLRRGFGPRTAQSLAYACMRRPAAYYEWGRALRSLGCDERDLVFCHMITQRNILEAALVARTLSASTGCRFVFLLRYSREMYKPERLETRLACRLLAELVRAGRLRLATDSDNLAEHLATLIPAPFEVFPIPHTAGVGCEHKAHSRRGLRLGSLGNARLDKGFCELAGAISMLVDEPPSRPVEIVIQINDPGRGCQAAVDRLRSLCCPGVTLIDSSLSSAAYRELLESLDIVLVPYQADAYRARTSGVFIEAVAAGKPVLVTKGTWMADQMRRWGAGVLIADASAAAIADGIRRAVAGFDAMSVKARMCAASCQSHHSPDAFVRALLGTASGADAPVTCPQAARDHELATR